MAVESCKVERCVAFGAARRRMIGDPGREVWERVKKQ
jgi:hypothetical protein